MKLYVVRKIVFCILLLLFLTSCATSDIAAEKTKVRLYTAYNMWYQKYGIMYCLNYQVGTVLPAGSEIQNAKIVRRWEDENHEDPYIVFSSVDTGMRFIVKFQSRFHPNRKLKDYFNLMFTQKKFSELTEGMQEKEIDAIKKSKVVKGMKKEAVIVSVGLPSDHRTPDLEHNKWYYWKNRFRAREICFNSKGITVACNELNDLL